MSGGIQRRDTVIPAAPSRRGRAVSRGERTSDFLGFELADERFAMPLATVRKILTYAPITEVPGSDSHVLGIVSVRGIITTVIDLRALLSMPSSEPTRGTRILLVDGGDEVLGLLVDRVLQVYRLQESEVELASTVAGDMSDYVLGIGRPGSHERSEEQPAGESPSNERDIMILLDPKALLRR